MHLQCTGKSLTCTGLDLAPRFWSCRHQQPRGGGHLPDAEGLGVHHGGLHDLLGREDAPGDRIHIPGLHVGVRLAPRVDGHVGHRGRRVQPRAQLPEAVGGAEELHVRLLEHVPVARARRWGTGVGAQAARAGDSCRDAGRPAARRDAMQAAAGLGHADSLARACTLCSSSGVIPGWGRVRAHAAGSRPGQPSREGTRAARPSRRGGRPRAPRSRAAAS